MTRRRTAIAANLGPFLGFQLVVFFLPLAILVSYSLGVRGSPASPPPSLGLEYYAALGNPPYANVLLRSLGFSFAATVLCLAIGYPVAYFLALRAGRHRGILVILVLIPFWVAFIVRTYALRQILHRDGLVYPVLVLFGWESGVPFLQSSPAVLLGLVYNYIPFMILPLYANMVGFDVSLIEASQSLGAGRVRTFTRVTLPLTLGGVVAGSLLVFIPATGELIVPLLLGGPGEEMSGLLIWRLFFQTKNWNVGSALSVVLIILTLVLVLVYMRLAQRKQPVGLL